MIRVRQRAFPAHVDSLREARKWATDVLSRVGTADEPCADAVLVLHELAAQTLGWLTPEHAEEAGFWLYIRAGIGTIGVGAVCESHWLASRPARDPRQCYRDILLDLLADEHSITRDDVQCTHHAELRWHAPDRARVPRPRTPAERRTLSGAPFHPRTAPPPGGPSLN